MKWDQIYPSTPRQTKSHLKSSIRPNNSDISIFKNQGGGKEPLGPHQWASLLLLSLSAVSSNFQFISLLVQLVDWNILTFASGSLWSHPTSSSPPARVRRDVGDPTQDLTNPLLSSNFFRSRQKRDTRQRENIHGLKSATNMLDESMIKVFSAQIWSRFFYHVYSRSPKLLQHSPTTPTTTCTRRWKTLRRRSLRLSSTWTCATSGKGRREEEGKLGIWLIMKIGSKEKVKMTS